MSVVRLRYRLGLLPRPLLRLPILKGGRKRRRKKARKGKVSRSKDSKGPYYRYGIRGKKHYYKAGSKMSRSMAKKKAMHHN